MRSGEIIFSLKRNLSYLIIGFLTILFYFVFLLLYLQDVIDGIVFIGGLFVSLIILVIALIVYRKKRAYKRKILLALCIISLLLCYELPLLGYESTSHAAYIYKEPLQVAEGSGIYLLGVTKVDFKFMESKNAVTKLLNEQHVDFLNIIEVTNQIRYGSKNRQLLQWIHLQKSEVEQMRENVKHYLGQENENINEFLNNDQNEGSSAGLGLVLSELIMRGDLQNDLSIAVTGGISAKGDVVSVGILKEKIQIAERYALSFMIIPSENAEEVAEIQKELSLNIQIFDVAHIDEAVQLINELNDKNK
ncbi:hypothetical protein JFL43_14705 [Viridibacillus sp. YIM B01967]|uniref:Lon proteolytic domain-containing protein n=1 Tax=Viridibacillus soli TaxID=2798301 RepID=A0ABS1H9K5_9BACL|nr:S16 family serine protease [Viridibacillus soli]MBK3496090.1 hypothetical protein [Viridibacillus soli]